MAVCVNVVNYQDEMQGVWHMCLFQANMSAVAELSTE